MTLPVSTVTIPQPEKKETDKTGAESGSPGATPPEPPKPDLNHLKRSLRHRREIWGAALVVLAGLAVFYTLYLARAFVLPIVLALLFSLLLKPAVRALSRLHVPEMISSLLIVLAFLGLTTGAIVRLTGPATTWLAPENLRRIEARVREVLRPAEKFTQASQAVEKITAPDRVGAHSGWSCGSRASPHVLRLHQKFCHRLPRDAGRVVFSWPPAIILSAR
jgi:hypothetical protein